MKLKIKGDIIRDDDKWIYEWFGIDAACPKDVEKAIEACADGETLEVEISSGGGDIHAGSEIYTALRSYKKGPVNIAVTGLAASAASVIAMAGHCEMSPTALMMIHNVSTRTAGDYREMEHTAEVLRTANESISAAYERKTGMERQALLDLMDRETWITAERAVELGFADGILGDEAGSEPLVAAAGMTISQETIERLRGILENRDHPADNQTDNGSALRARAEADYKFMMLKGAQRR